VLAAKAQGVTASRPHHRRRLALQAKNLRLYSFIYRLSGLFSYAGLPRQKNLILRLNFNTVTSC
jgi:hypothetical protein